MYKKSIVLFRKDLRLNDNTALYHAHELAQKVYPLFIFDPRQISNDNPYKSDNAIDFMVTSLQELDQMCKDQDGLFSYGYGIIHKCLKDILDNNTIDALFLNKDYTPFALERDKAIAKLCAEYNVAYHAYDDATLCVPGTVLTGKNTPYTIFTPFCKQALKQRVTDIRIIKEYKFATSRLKTTQSLEQVLEKFSYVDNPHKYVSGGTSEALKIIKKLDYFSNYDKKRDFPELPTTFLAAHIKFGTVSIRHVYKAIIDKTENATLLKQLYWRDFFIQLAYHYPHVFKTAFKQKYANIQWSFNKEYFKAWCEGKTGFPIVDAGMRQLNQTGYMHNRVRMIVAFLLTKNLNISWQEGERYFAQKLTDYDPCVNNGSWQWCSSTGADSVPYFRVFNPWSQQKKFDPECTYIKKWVPELKNISPEVIHNYYKNKTLITKNYPLPIVDHASTSAYAKKFLK